MTRRRTSTAAALILTALLSASVARAQSPVNPVDEAKNQLVGNERRAGWATPQMLAGVGQTTLAYQQKRQAIRQSDPERAPDPVFCTAPVVCPIDPRLEDWKQHGGIVKPVLFTARSGATLSGHVWATKSGPKKRPGVYIINGSIVGFEELYTFLAQALARDGYEVLTFDPQGEGLSDQYGVGPDRNEGAYAGTPLTELLKGKPGLGGSGLSFYDGGADALRFFLSTPKHPYSPVLSRGTGTSHAGKQARRVKAGLDTDHNPLWRMLDRKHVGVTGHSYGSQAASWLVQKKKRLQTAVALDSLCVPVSPSPDEVDSLLGYPGNKVAGTVPMLAPYAFAAGCFGAPDGPAPKITKPVLGLTADYLIPYAPYLTKPNPKAKNIASERYSKRGVDTGQIVVRGGTHFEFGDEPTGVLPASLRGIDLATWYTLAWFDKYLKGDPTADRRLLTSRWRNDEIGGKADPGGDANLFSTYYRSRLDITRTNGKGFDCEDLRQGCSGQPTAKADCGLRKFSFLALDVKGERFATCRR